MQGAACHNVNIRWQEMGSGGLFYGCFGKVNQAFSSMISCLMLENMGVFYGCYRSTSRATSPACYPSKLQCRSSRLLIRRQSNI